VESHCRHRSPAVYDQTISIETRVGKINRATFHFEYAIHDAATALLLADGYTAHALVGKDGKLRRFDRDFMARIRRLAGHAG
jgi:acyl-CoA thioesterase FadM